jgi:hypothetical protein
VACRASGGRKPWGKAGGNRFAGKPMGTCLPFDFPNSLAWAFSRSKTLRDFF